MPPYKEQGIVLRSMKLGEADKIVTILTQGHGKIRAVAKGIRKPGSRFGARLEPTTHVALQCYRGRSDLVVGAGRPVGIKVSGGIREAGRASTYLDLVRATLGRDWPSPRTFRIGASALLDALVA